MNFSPFFRNAVLGLAVVFAPLTLNAADDDSGLNEKADGGAAVFSNVTPAGGELVPAGLAASHPVGQQARMFVLGGSVRGFGMLAAYDTAGSRSFVVARRTHLGGREPFTPIALARVFDPQGNVAAVEEFTEQTGETECRVIEVPNGQPGIWRVSFSGGRKDDLVEIRLKETPVWGVRGEMALGVTASTPRPAYLWIPPNSKTALVGVESGLPAGLEIRDAAGKNVLAKPAEDPARRAARLLLDPAPVNTVCRVELPSKFTGAVVFAGAPGLLCPSERAARRLAGGTVEYEGVITAGPLQARARAWMVEHAAKLDKSLSFRLPAQAPENFGSPEIQMLGLGKYGPLNHLDWLSTEQNKHLDPRSPTFGGFRDPRPDELAEPTWQNFGTYRNVTMWEAPSMAAAVTLDSPWNPAFHSAALTERTALAAFGNLVSMQGDDIVREGSLFKTRYPMVHAFFIYAAETQAFELLKDLLPEDSKAIWKEGIMAIGDKIADFQGYQSNQWAHMLRGHLDVYLATGEKRFLGYFERLAAAYLDNTFGPGSKYGQHPAGFFLEECGPDGNYDKLNSFNIVSCYQDYRELPNAKPALVKKLENAIQKNLRFSSFFWLPEPDGKVTSPNAMNCRTLFGLGGAGYPGAFLPKSEFPLAAARYALTGEPEPGVGEAGTFSFVANTDGWMRRCIAQGLADGAGKYPQASGCWTPVLVKAYSLPKKVEPAVLPVEEQGGSWTLPGLAAWNRGGLYGVVFYDVEGANHRLNGMTGGAVSALWTKPAGAFICSRLPANVPAHAADVKITGENSLTFACVYGTGGDGKFFYSGKERAKLKTSPEGYRIESKLEAPAAPVAWSYEPGANELKLSVQMKAQTQEQYVNLPLSKRLPDAKVQLAGKNALLFDTPRGGVRMEWPEAYAGALKPSVLGDVERLVIPLPRDGSPLVIKIRQVRK